MTEDLLFSGPVQAVPFSFKLSLPASVDGERAAELHVYSWLLPSLSPPKTVQEYRAFWLSGQERVSVHLCKHRVASWLLTQRKRSWGDAETCQTCRSAADVSSGAAKRYKQLWLADHVKSELWDVQYTTMLSVDNDSLHGCRSSVTFILVSAQNIYGFFCLFVFVSTDIFHVSYLSFCHLISEKIWNWMSSNALPSTFITHHCDFSSTGCHPVLGLWPIGFISLIKPLLVKSPLIYKVVSITYVPATTFGNFWLRLIPIFCS